MIVVVRHAEAMTRIVGGPSEEERPLTELGSGQADGLVPQLTGYGVAAVVSSPYRRAFDTVAPTARALGLDVSTTAELREWDDGFETVEDWLPLYERCWRDPDHRYGAGETHRELMTRATTAIHRLLARSNEGVVIAASHGTWIARGLEGIGAHVSIDFWRAMPLPAVYEISRSGSGIVVTGPGLPAR